MKEKGCRNREYGNRNRRREGFTLTEVLLTVAILAVIFAVSLTGLIAFQTNLRQKELDSKAELIYVAAQNRMTEIMASGRASLYTPIGEENGEAEDVLLVDVTPRDSAQWESGESAPKLYYVTSAAVGTGEASTAAILLPESRIDGEVRENYWVIEYSPESGSIYGVFYSEKPMDYTPERYNSLRIKKMRLRAGAEVGYYGGDVTVKLDTGTLAPQIAIENEERLIATITCVAPDAGELEFDIRVSDEFGNAWTKTAKRADMTKASGAWVYQLVIDEMTAGGRFKEKFSELVPGSDLKIKCTARSKNDLIDEGSIEAETNSLFDSVESGKALISYGRHLQNLDESSGINENLDKISISAAIQKSNVHFDDDPENIDDWYSLYGEDAYKPINNPNLLSYAGNYAQETRGSAARSIIYGLRTTEGLFETFYGTSLRDITLSGAAITGGTSAGALCANTASTGSLTISGCRVYLDEAYGDLTGKTEKDIWIRGTDYVGGLIGCVHNNVQIEESFAATVVGSTETLFTGGLAGFVSDSGALHIQKSYADCYLYGKSVGGLVGGSQSEDVYIQNSYGAGFLYASREAAGFIPADIRNAIYSYSAMSFEGDSAENYAIAKSYSETVHKLFYIAAAKISNHVEDAEEKVSYTTLSSRKDFVANHLGSAFTAETGGTGTQAYNLMPLGLTDYSFPKLDGLTHYGDWQAAFEDASPVYYEQYGENSYGIFGANVDSLESAKTVVGDGYGVVYGEEPTKEVAVDYLDDGGKKASATLDPRDAVKISDELYLLKLPRETVNTRYTSGDYYQEIEIGGITYYYNPHFAKTMTTTRSEGAESAVHIRSPRQLYNLSLYYENYAETTENSIYMQELDIDYEKYEWSEYYGTVVTTQNPIGKGKELAFTASYSGGGKTICGVSFINEKNDSYLAGMFGDNRGVLSNIFVVWDYTGSATEDKTVEISSPVAGNKAQAYMGCLAGKNSKVIRGCGAAGYTFKCRTYENSSSYVGGLVGLNAGSISSSYADTPVFTIAAHYANVLAGGFVGENDNVIKSSYASGAMELTEARGGDEALGGFYGMNNGSISSAYCMTAVITTGSGKGYSFGQNGGELNACYYLADGTYFYVQQLRLYNLISGDPRATAITTAKLKNLSLSGFTAAEISKYNEKTKANDTGKFPYPAVATNSAGKTVHYGNWVTEAQLGEVGVFYWECETGGANDGYHIRYLGIKEGKRIEGTSLCTVHDDGGVISEYGYGYYTEKDSSGNLIGTTTLATKGFGNMGDINAEASEAIEELVQDFKVYAYTTGSTGTSSLYLKEGYASGTWTLTHTDGKKENTYTFNLSPFFANALGYDDEEAPGTENHQYEIRSAEQLQYINWNGRTKSTATVVSASASTSWGTKKWTAAATNEYFPYLRYVSSTAGTVDWNYYWKQTHDVDNKSKSFSPIGSMFYTTTDDSGNAYIAYFAGAYDGQSYMIKNIEIHSDYDMVGLFGITVGAKLENIVMYSDAQNVIETTSKGEKWYCLGGLVGFAAKGNSDEAVITNCTVSGYTIQDSRSRDGGWGGASVGGLAGACNMSLKKCTAVNDIIVQVTYDVAYENIRVGGLVGNLRGQVDSCYCGGSIESKTSTYGTDTGHYTTSIWTGGINGGIVMINYGNLSTLVGSTTSGVTVKNSYSYVQMPATGSHQIKSSQSIASIGEMQSASFNTSAVKNPYVYIYNCYAYEPNSRNTDDYKSRSGSSYWNGQNNIHTGATTSKLRLYNEGKSPYVTYEELSAKAGVTGSVLDALNGVDQANFGFVTTVENGANIEGKYSYPGGDINLEGGDYPFPTVLTQTDTLGNMVNVHYGTWPKGSIYWEMPRLSFDLLENYDKTIAAARASINLMTEGNAAYSYFDESGNPIEDYASGVIVDSASETESGIYEVNLKAGDTGTQFIRATFGESSADLMVNITAKMQLASNTVSLELKPGEEKTIQFTAKSINGIRDFTEATQWTVKAADENIVDVKPNSVTYNSEAGVWEAVVIADKEGSTSLTARASYSLTFGSEQKRFTQDIIIQVKVED